MQFQTTRKANPPNPNPIEWIMGECFTIQHTTEIVSEQDWSQVMIRRQAKLLSCKATLWATEKLQAKRVEFNHHSMEQQKWLYEKSERTERHHNYTLRTPPQCLKYAFETTQTVFYLHAPKSGLPELPTWSFPMLKWTTIWLHIILHLKTCPVILLQAALSHQSAVSA